MCITIDSCLWIDLIDKKNSSRIKNLLNFCKDNKISIHSSSRVYNFDSVKMDLVQQKVLYEIINKYSVIIDSSPFRFGSVSSKLGSRFSNGDYLSSISHKEEEGQFEEVFGSDPIKLPKENTGARLSNWISDYDSLKQHYLNKRDVFVTNDKKIYFSEEKRILAKKKLKLIILDVKDTFIFLKKYT